MRDPRSACDEDHLLEQAQLPGAMHEVLHVPHVDIVLSDDLRDEDGIGLLGFGTLEELVIQDLRAQVSRVDPLVALEPVIPGETLHIHDRIDADQIGRAHV